MPGERLLKKSVAMRDDWVSLVGVCEWWDWWDCSRTDRTGGTRGEHIAQKKCSEKVAICSLLPAFTHLTLSTVSQPYG